MVNSLHIHALNAKATRGILKYGNLTMPCRLGRSGRKYRKKEGDGASPRGKFNLKHIYYRNDRKWRPHSLLLRFSLKSTDGWCDHAGHRNYNRKITLPVAVSHETLFREDRVYDVIITTTHNQRPRIQGAGSAIFLHLTKPDESPTAGCIAISARDMRILLPRLNAKTKVVI